MHRDVAEIQNELAGQRRLSRRGLSRLAGRMSHPAPLAAASRIALVRIRVQTRRRVIRYLGSCDRCCHGYAGVYEGGWHDSLRRSGKLQMDRYDLDTVVQDMPVNILWALAGVLALVWWFQRSQLKRDYYVVETVSIIGDVGGAITDIEGVSGGSLVMDVRYDVTLNGPTCALRRKNQREIFANKHFDVFDDHVAAKDYFVCQNELYLDSSQSRFLAVHRIILWAVTAVNRDSVPERLVKAKGNARRLAETDYSALLKMYRSNA